MTDQTRFKSAKIDTDQSIGLRPDHPALSEARTIFPKSVVSPDESDRMLISGHNNPKLGSYVSKGAKKDYAIYHLSLEERKTCPTSCYMWSSCYGNAMPYARRHSVENIDALFETIISELEALVVFEENLLIRLHTLGDFFSVKYVNFWSRILDEFPEVSCFGYTSNQLDSEDKEEQKIAKAIKKLTDKHWDRFAIRFSSETPQEQGATVVSQPEDNLLMCPAQSEKTACCATCGLCWDKSTKNQTIGFLQHGMKKWKPKMHDFEPDNPYVSVSDINIGKSLGSPSEIGTTLPKVELLSVNDLYIDARYQRVIRSDGRKNIRHIVENFNWMHFQPLLVSPIGQRDGRDAYTIVDGQHRAIAALNHPDVHRVPCAVVPLEPEQQAHVFAEINSRIVKVNALEIFWARYFSGDQDAISVHRCVVENACLNIPRYKPSVGLHNVDQWVEHVWDVTRISTLIKLYNEDVVANALFFIIQWDYSEPAALNYYHLNAISRYLYSQKINDTEAVLELAEKLAEKWSYDDAFKYCADLPKFNSETVFYDDILVPCLSGGKSVAA